MLGCGFWCRKCGGRVFEDDPYKNGEGRVMAVLTCLLCAKEHECSYSEYRHLKKEIERVLRSKGSQRKILPI